MNIIKMECIEITHIYNTGGQSMARKCVDINKLLEETKELEHIDTSFELIRIDIDALLDEQEICELSDKNQE
jgi:hypothetical protein